MRDCRRASAGSLDAAQSGDGAPLRELADGFYGRMPDGRTRPLLDQFFAVSAADQRKPPRLEPYLHAGADAWRVFDHSLGESACLDAHVNAYLEHGDVPPPGARCRQETE